MIKLLVPDLMPSLLALVFVVVGMVAAAAAQVPAPDDVAAAPSDAEKSGSGLASKVVQAGTGSDHPSGSDEVTVHYTGWLTNGQMFDSSVTRGEPTSFPLGNVIAGWTEGVQLMAVGSTYTFAIHPDQAYGAPGRGPVIGPNAVLLFDIELISIN